MHDPTRYASGDHIQFSYIIQYECGSKTNIAMGLNYIYGVKYEGDPHKAAIVGIFGCKSF